MNAYHAAKDTRLLGEVDASTLALQVSMMIIILLETIALPALFIVLAAGIYHIVWNVKKIILK
jgi:hypothetical protein